MTTEEEETIKAGEVGVVTGTEGGVPAGLQTDVAAAGVPPPEGTATVGHLSTPGRGEAHHVHHPDAGATPGAGLQDEATHSPQLDGPATPGADLHQSGRHIRRGGVFPQGREVPWKGALQRGEKLVPLQRNLFFDQVLLMHKGQEYFKPLVGSNGTYRYGVAANLKTA